MSGLKEQLAMYEQGDLDALDQILSSSISNMPDNDEEVTIVSELDDLDEADHNDAKRKKDKKNKKPEKPEKPNKYSQTNNKTSTQSNTLSNTQQNTTNKSALDSLDERSNELDEIERNRNNHTETLDEQQEIRSDTPSGQVLTREIRKEIGSLTNEWVRLQEGLERINKMKTQFRKEQLAKEAVLKHFIDQYRLKDITKGKHKLIPQIKKGGKKGFNKRVIANGLVEFFSTLDMEDPEQVAEQATEFLDERREKIDDQVVLRHETLNGGAQ